MHYAGIFWICFSFSSWHDLKYDVLIWISSLFQNPSIEEAKGKVKRNLLLPERYMLQSKVHGGKKSLVHWRSVRTPDFVSGAQLTIMQTVFSYCFFI